VRRGAGSILHSVLRTDDLLLTRAQRDLYAELGGEDTAAHEEFVQVLVARVVVLVRHRCVHGRESRITLERAQRAHQLVCRDLRDPESRAAVWSLVEWLTRWPWGPGAHGAIDRLVVAGAISDELARESA
jgi:hypothetical protein